MATNIDPIHDTDPDDYTLHRFSGRTHDGLRDRRRRERARRMDRRAKRERQARCVSWVTLETLSQCPIAEAYEGAAPIWSSGVLS